MHVVWRMIRKMNGINSYKEIPVIEEEGEMNVTNKEKTEVLAKTFAKIHSIENLDEKFLKRRQEISKVYKNVHTKKQGVDNIMDEVFNSFELKIAINNSKNTTPGRDMISYSMLKNLPEVAFKAILDLYNHIWSEGILPKDWKSAIVIPIVKPGKDATKANSYRPIALTSTLCKVMEKMIVRRLSYFLEKKEILTSDQSGFRKKRSTMDALILFENDVKKALLMKEYLIAVFFDIEKAYDTLWREGLLIKLNKIGVGGRMYNWILDFLFERTFQVRIGEEMSTSYDILNGTPQGSVISPILFNLMINDIFEKLNPNIGKALYADDGAVWKRGRNLRSIVKGIQEAIHEVERWSVDWGLKFSVAKTQYMIFTKKKKMEQITLKLYDQPLERVSEFKYLGLIFDGKLTWKRHIKKIENKCKGIINCMVAISKYEWGASKRSLLHVYQALIRSSIDYGCTVYGAGSKLEMKKLENIQSKALRICCGAIRSTPLDAIRVEMGEMPLDLRREKMSLMYWVNLQGSERNHHTRTVLKDCWEYKKNGGNSFGWKYEQWVKECDLKDEVICPNIPLHGVSVWNITEPVVEMRLLDAREKEEGYSNSFEISGFMRETFYSFIQIYTDGSKDPVSQKVGIGVYIPRFKSQIILRLSDKLSVYSTELSAIIVGLQWVEQVKPNRVVICSDSSSALKSIMSTRTDREDLLVEIYTLLYRLKAEGIVVYFCWVPAHIGIVGNEKADQLAKEALKKNLVDIKVPLGRSEVKSVINKEIIKLWQQRWENSSTGRWYYNIEKSVRKNEQFYGRHRKEEVMISRLRFGHTGLNSTLAIMGKHENGMCDACDVLETIEHVFFKCNKYHDERNSLFSNIKNKPVSVVDLLGKGLRDNQVYMAVLTFLKCTGLEYRI
uniref:RNA-directed DNA polymerase from mobile element jockey n=1 Tax=Cyprinus carpio TaxID=7962 RepID=A0A8C1TCJ5_CYPCA